MPVSRGRKKAKNRPAPPPKKVDPVKAKGPSPVWYVALMFGLMGLGVIVIIINYVGVLPGGTDNRYLIAGLGAIAVGFGMTLNYR
jgi:Cell division protein CrgA